MKNTDHTFAICAYGESPYLEACILSLRHQTVPTNLLMVTSTPNDLIRSLAEKYKIPLYIHEGERGITQDWNFAYAKAGTAYVTLAHQDDLYHSRYVETMLQYMKSSAKPLIFFTDYAEIRGEKIVSVNKLLVIKRILLLPMNLRVNRGNRWIRRRMLSLGSAICCPSVTFARENLPEVVFANHFRSDEDWEAWEKISRLDGEFLFCRKPLMLHRIHGDSETTRILRDHQRGEEDLQMYRKFWPEPVAKVLAKEYRSSEKYNSL